MKQKKQANEYKSFAEWRERNFPKLQRESELKEIKNDSGQLGVILANESIDRALQKR